MSRRARRAPLLLAVPVLALALTGCAKKIDQQDLEKKISQSLSQQLGGTRPVVHCPGGKEAKKGNTFACTATLTGQKATIQVRLTDDNGRFTYQVRQ